MTAHEDRLTKREKEVLALVALGKSNKEIARLMVITSNTVKDHVSAIIAKLDATNRAGAVAEAFRRGLMT